MAKMFTGRTANIDVCELHPAIKWHKRDRIYLSHFSKNNMSSQIQPYAQLCEEYR